MSARSDKQREAYRYARAMGLPRAQAKQFSTKAQVDRALGRVVQKHTPKHYGVAPPTVQLQHNPYHYIVKGFVGKLRESARYKTITVVSEVPLTPDEVFSRATAIWEEDYEVQVYSTAIVESQRWEV